MKSFKDFLGPEATKKQDADEIARQKKHLDDKAKEYYDQGAREGGHNAAIAKGITMDLAKKNIKESNKSNPFTRVDLDKIAKSKKREEKEKGLLRKPGSSMKKNTMNYIDKVDKLSENDESINEDLRKWFKQKWVRMDTKGNIKGDCAREPGEGKPKCLPQARAHALGKEGRASAAQRKRREDPNPERRGAPINVRTESAAAAIAAATAISKKKSGNYDSDGFRKTPYKNPDSPMRKSNAQRKKEMEEACWPRYKRKKGTQEFAQGSCVKEDGESGGGFGPGPTNVVGGGAIAGSGGAGGEPGVSKKRNPVMSFFKRKKPKM
jgi:hypothetical protein